MRLPVDLIASFCPSPSAWQASILYRVIVSYTNKTPVFRSNSSATLLCLWPRNKSVPGSCRRRLLSQPLAPTPPGQTMPAVATQYLAETFIFLYGCHPYVHQSVFSISPLIHIGFHHKPVCLRVRHAVFCLRQMASQYSAWNAGPNFVCLSYALWRFSCWHWGNS